MPSNESQPPRLKKKDRETTAGLQGTRLTKKTIFRKVDPKTTSTVQVENPVTRSQDSGTTQDRSSRFEWLNPLRLSKSKYHENFQAKYQNQSWGEIYNTYEVTKTLVDEQRVKNLMSKIIGYRHSHNHRDHIYPSKETLLLHNLKDQLTIDNNTYSIEQLKDKPFNYNLKQIWNSNIRSKYQAEFFSLDHATGKAAVVDFAHDTFGGRVIGNGLTQEEKDIMLQTNLLIEAENYSGLSKDPLYIKARQTHKFVDHGKRLYGDSRYGRQGRNTIPIDTANITPENVNQYFQKLWTPKEVNIIAMAAKDMRHKKTYDINDLKQMFKTAFKGLNAHAEKEGRVVHTGAWGAGVFKNSENTACVIQILAAQAAGVQLFYHGNKEAYESAIRFLKRNSDKTYNETFNSLFDMQTKHKHRQFWRPKP